MNELMAQRKTTVKESTESNSVDKRSTQRTKTVKESTETDSGKNMVITACIANFFT